MIHLKDLTIAGTNQRTVERTDLQTLEHGEVEGPRSLALPPVKLSSYAASDQLTA